MLFLKDTDEAIHASLFTYYSENDDSPSTPTILREVHKVTANLLHKAEKLLQWSRQKYYTCANKSGPMLANLLNICIWESKHIKLCLPNNVITANPSTIVDKIYLSTTLSTLSMLDIGSFPLRPSSNPNKLPSSSQTMLDTMEAEITILKVLKAIKSLKRQKISDPDGFSTTYS